MEPVVEHRLAQINVSRARAPLDDPVMAGFVTAMDRIGLLASNSRGFVWQLGEGHPVTAGDLLVNLSVWTAYEPLHEFVYRSRHGSFVRRRAEWFVPVPQPSTALWWVRAGELPTAEEGLRRLAVLRQYGPSPRAFSLRRRFGPDGEPDGPRRPSPAPGPAAGASPP